MPVLHPATCLAGWLLTALVLQFLPPAPLFLALLASGLALVLCEPKALIGSLRRMKWLLLAMVLALGWSVPGQALWPGVWAPTREGLGQGAQQAARVLTLVWLIRLLWLRYRQEGVLAGLYVLLRPGRWLGLPVEKIGLRLALTLAHAERLQAEPPGLSWENWRRELFGVAQAMPDRVELKLYRHGWPDAAFLLLLAALAGFLMKVWA
nr:hypothetical protein [Chromobacterium sp. ASV5]